MSWPAEASVPYDYTSAHGEVKRTDAIVAKYGSEEQHSRRNAAAEGEERVWLFGLNVSKVWALTPSSPEHRSHGRALSSVEVTSMMPPGNKRDSTEPAVSRACYGQNRQDLQGQLDY